MYQSPQFCMRIFAPGRHGGACPGWWGWKTEEVCGHLHNPRRVLHSSTLWNGNSDRVCVTHQQIPTDSGYTKVIWWKKLTDMEDTYHRLKPSFSRWLTNTDLSNSGNCGFMLTLPTTNFTVPQKTLSFVQFPSKPIFYNKYNIGLSMSFPKKVALYYP